VIGATDLTGVERSADGSELVTPMPAHVGERSESAVLLAAQKHSFSGHVDGAQLAGSQQLVESPDAHPVRAPEMVELPFQHLGREVGVGRERQALPEAFEHCLDLALVEWRRLHVDLSYRLRTVSVS
jgi:hypothetical protein